LRPVSKSRRLVLLASLTVGVSACLSTVITEKSGGIDVLPHKQVDLDVPFITTPDNVVLTILNIARVTKNDFVLDLGSGDGRIPITAAARYGARSLGVEIDSALVKRSIDNAKTAKVDHLVNFKVQDLFETDLSVASVITMYLLPDVNLKLKPALQKLKEGTRIVSHGWDMGDWLPSKTEIVAAPHKKVGLIKQSKIMLWVVQ
jgi:SAM-dependent methyltransferase